MLYRPVISLQTVSHGDAIVVRAGDGKAHRIDRGIRGKVRTSAARVSEVAPGAQCGFVRKMRQTRRVAFPLLQVAEWNWPLFAHRGKRFAGVKEGTGHCAAFLTQRRRENSIPLALGFSAPLRLCVEKPTDRIAQLEVKMGPF